jgi:protoporphyrinogen oxidase
MNKNQRIAIIGAGPGGLAAAEALKDKGYTNVVVYEKSAKAGGMAQSRIMKAEDGTEYTYEMGSAAPMSGKELKKLIKRHGLTYGKGILPKKCWRYYDNNKKAFDVDFYTYHLGYPIKNFFLLLLDGFKLIQHLWKYRELKNPGFSQIKKENMNELTLTISEWVDSRQFHIIGRRLKFSLIGFLAASNPKAANEYPVMYGIKTLYHFIKFPFRYLDGSYVPLKEGYQTLWERVAALHKVVFNARITEIIREDQKIKITYENEHNELLHDIFDKVIISCDPADLQGVMSFSKNEEAVFSKHKSIPGVKIAAIIKNMNQPGVISNYQSYFYEKEENRVPVSLMLPEVPINKTTWLYTIGVPLLDGGIEMPEGEIKLFRSYLKESFNAELVEIMDSHYWPFYSVYFPCAAVRQLVFQQFEALQGENNTYYVGQILSGGTHSVVVEYAYDFVNRHF